jgi:Protein of unknown function (DUF3617)
MKARRRRLASLTSTAACGGLLLWSPFAPADPEAAKPIAATPPAGAPARAAAETAVDTELPAFQPGLWEYRRTVIMGNSTKPQVSTVRKCADPAAEIRDKTAALKKKNCQFTPVQRKQERYLSSWTCPTPVGPMRFRDVLIATSTTSYQDTSEARSAQGVTQQKIEATRLGECPGSGARAPLTPAPRRRSPSQEPKSATG